MSKLSKKLNIDWNKYVLFISIRTKKSTDYDIEFCMFKKVLQLICPYLKKYREYLLFIESITWIQRYYDLFCLSQKMATRRRKRRCHRSRCPTAPCRRPRNAASPRRGKAGPSCPPSHRTYRYGHKLLLWVINFPSPPPPPPTARAQGQGELVQALHQTLHWPFCFIIYEGVVVFIWHLHV